jgi:dephospho-CoA kinase
MKVIAIVGMPGSGKSVLSNYFRSKGYPVIRFGEIIINEIKRRGLPVTPLNEQRVREEIRENIGMDACAQLALPLIRETLKEHSVTIIDGLYSFSEFKTLKEAFGSSLVLIAVFTPKQLRYQRLSSRAERPLQRVEVEERDFREIEKIEKGGPIALADYTLLNSGSVTELIREAENLLPSILAEA